MSRNGAGYTSRFPQVTQAVAKLKPTTVHLDGELVAMDQVGSRRLTQDACGSRMRPMATSTLHQQSRRYWVVSPNVKYDEGTVNDWRAASVREKAAFMGWEPDDYDHAKIGPKFAGTVAGGIEPGNVILIARRHKHQPEIVGFGVVQGKYVTNIK